MAGRTQLHHSHLSCHIPPSAHPEGLIPGGSAGCILSLPVESILVPRGARAEVGFPARVWVTTGRVDAPLSCRLCLGLSEKEEGGSCQGSSENEKEAGVMERHLGRLPCWVSQFCPCKCEVRQRHRPPLDPTLALRCRGLFGMELTKFDQASSSPSSANSVGLEDGPLPQPSQQSWALPPLAHRAWVALAHTSTCSRMPLSKEASVPPPFPEASSFSQGPSLPKSKYRKEGS